jgi:exosortase C (VPDSG-CTERM-specific)
MFETTAQSAVAKSTPKPVPPGSTAPFAGFAIAAAMLALCFAKPLYDLIRFSLSEHLYSHILLIPFISAYLIWTERKQLPEARRGSFAVAAVPAILGLGIFSIYALLIRGDSLPKSDSLFWTILPFSLLLASLVLLFLGTTFAKAIAFPLGFFFFIAPFPEAVTNALEIGSQVASAEVYDWMIWSTGTPYARDGQTFHLPRLPLVIAQECSGIRSSFVLFLTSLLAGHMFLGSGWKKGLLAFVVIPLGIIRNGFRVLVLSLLTVYWDPEVINGPLHHRGGPIFFALSLIPFFLLLFWLRKTDGSARRPIAPDTQ